MKSIYFENPVWLLGLCALFGLVLAMLVYYKNNKLSEWSTLNKMGLACLRFLIGFTLAALLLSPFLKSFVTETIQPTLLFAIDNSMSIRSGMDSTVLNQTIQDLKSGISDLSKDFDTDVVTFGRDITVNDETSFTQKETDISQVIQYALDQYSPDNLGSIVLWSDGIYNRGYHPGYDANKLASPIISVALGDTIPKQDVSIKNVYHNKIAYLGDKFPVQCDLQAKNLNGQSSRLRLYKISNNGQRQEIKKSKFTINSDNYFTTIDFTTEAKSPGINHYRLYADKVSGERIQSNNVKDIYIDVIDARQSILIYAAASHPDIGAIKKALDTKKNYITEVKMPGDKNIVWSKYNLVIFHSLPDRSENLKSILNQLDKKRIARFFIVGTSTHLNGLNAIQKSIDAKGGASAINNASAIRSPSFNLFKLNKSWMNSLSIYPPLQSPFGQYKTSPGTTPLLHQKIGNIETQYPLLTLSKRNNIKEAVLVGEGLWRWRLFNYVQEENHEEFDDFFTSIIQYLNVKDDRRRFKTALAKSIFNENERIRIDAELYNQSYELINEPESFLSIKDRDGKEYDYTFDKVDDYYSLDLGTLPVGDYRSTATTLSNGERLTASSRFSVQPVQLELYETTADHALLRDLASATNGQVIYPNQINQLPEIIRSHKSIKPVQYQQSKTTPFLNLKWLLGILILALAMEWIMRRYNGTY